MPKNWVRFFNQDCIKGAKDKIKDNSVDLIITDPPYGINGDKFHQHYNREESFVLDGYIEIPEENYPKFCINWIEQAERILRPGGMRLPYRQRQLPPPVHPQPGSHGFNANSGV